MDELEKILQKANELGHLLLRHEIVQRYHALAQKLDASESSSKLLEEHATAARAVYEMQQAGETVPPEEEARLAELEEKVRQDQLIREFLATEGYYVHLMRQVQELMTRPRGEPPPQSDIIVPGQGGSSRIIIP